MLNDLELTSLDRLRWVFSHRLGSQADVIRLATEALQNSAFGATRESADAIIARLAEIIEVAPY